MKITNNHNLPLGLVRNIEKKAVRPDEGVIRMTQLIEPPLIRRLLIEKWDEIEADAADFIWSMLGTGFHSAVASDIGNALTEERFSTAFNGVVITGQPDYYAEDTLIDYKTVSVSGIKASRMEKWRQQVNGYAWLLHKNSFDVKQAYIIAALRDWSVYNTGGYPTQIATIPVRLMPIDEIEAFLSSCVKRHLEAPTPCTPEERWQKPQQYGVKASGNKNFRWFYTEQERNLAADQYIDKGRQVELATHPKENIRCERFCPVRSVCPYKQM